MSSFKQEEFDFKDKTPTLSPVLKDFIKGPIFAARSQPGTREICVDGNFWSIGVEHPIERWCNKSLSIKHGRICFALLEFWRQQHRARSLHFSIGELCRLYSNSDAKGGRYYRDLLEILFDLRDTWVQIARPDGSVEKFTIIGDIKVVTSARGSIKLERVDLSPEFFNLLNAIESMAYIRLDILNTIPSAIAAATYTFLPSRAYYHNSENPFQISLTTLLEQIGLDVPETKSQRKKIFTQNSDKKSRSILEQLDGAQLSNGVLRAKLSECADHSDYKLLIWVDSGMQSSNAYAQGKLFEHWLKAGRGEQEFKDRIACIQPLSDYEEVLLKRCEIEIPSMRRFLEKAKVLLGSSKFQTILASIKADKIEKKKGIKNLKAKLIRSLIDAIRNT